MERIAPARLLMSLLAACAASTATAQETFLLRIGGRVGQKWTQTTAMAGFSAGSPAVGSTGDTSWIPRLRSIAYWTRTVLEVAVDSLTFGDVSDSTRIELPGAGELPSPPSATGTRLTLLSRVDTRGRVATDTSRYGEGRQRERRSGTGDELSGLPLPEQPVAVGESWGDSAQLRFEDGTPSSRVRRWRLERVDIVDGARIAVISETSSLSYASSSARGQSTVTKQYQLDLTGGSFRSVRSTMVGTRTTERGIELSRSEYLTICNEVRQAR